MSVGGDQERQTWNWLMVAILFMYLPVAKTLVSVRRLCASAAASEHGDD